MSDLVFVVAESLLEEVGALVGIVQRRLHHGTLFQQIGHLTFQLVALVAHQVKLAKIKCIYFKTSQFTGIWYLYTFPLRTT